MNAKIPGAVVLLVAAAALALDGCAARPAPPAPEAAAPAVAHGHDHASSSAPARERVGYSAADVAFMQHMIHHHAQALVMTALVSNRASRLELALLAGRIDASQLSEIESMQRWLRKRGEHAPDPVHVRHDRMATMPAMPGMLSESQLAELRAARGAAFDRLFLERMIQHHEGALSMVADLFATPGAAQESEIFRLATDVDADQRAEIARMQKLLNTLPTTPTSR